MNQKSIIAILGVVVVILIGTTVYFATTSKESQPVAPAPKLVQQPVSTPATQQPTQQVTPTPQPAQGIVYTNTQYGFQLNFPDSWKGYSVKNLAPEQKEVRFDFGVPNLDGIFTVFVYTKDQWNKILADNEVFDKGDVLGTTEKNVYVFGQGAMFRGGDEPEDEKLATAVRAVKEIKSSFKLTK